MNREQLIAHLILLGWEPSHRHALVHPEHGGITCNREGACWKTGSMIRGINYSWNDIESRILRAAFHMVEKLNK